LFVLIWIRKIYKTLSADASPAAIAFGVLFGLTLGFIPLFSGLGMLLIASTLIFRVQISSMLLAFGLSKLLYAAGLKELFLPIGSAILETESLKGFWTWFLNLPVITWLDLDRLAVTGGAAAGLALGLILFWPICALINGYRRYVHEKVSQNRFFKWLTNFWVIKILRFIFLGVQSAG
jgi:uncharacterized protein (TIGR03546 family)